MSRVRAFWRFLLLSRDELRENRLWFLLCLVSGITGAVLFRHSPGGLLAWVALAPYFFALGRFTTPRSVVYGTYLFGITWYYLNLWWLHTLTVFSILIPLGVPALAIVQATYFLAFAFPARFVLQRFSPAAAPWVLGPMWAGMEYLRTWTDLAFPWNYLGHSQVMLHDGKLFFPAILQTAEFAGTYGISALVAAVNACIAVSLWAPSDRLHRRYSWGSALVLVCFVGFVVAWGFHQLIPRKDVPETSIRVAAIQPGISQVEKWDAMMGVPGDTPQQAAARYQAMEDRMKGAAETLLRQAKTAYRDENVRDPQLYVMPESTFFSGYFIYQTDLHQRLHQLSRELGGDLFFGADNRMPRTDYEKMAALRARAADAPLTFSLPLMPMRVDDRGTTVFDWEKEPAMIPMVAAWQVTPELGLSDVVYNKVQLVPFGEMIPFVSSTDWLRNKLEAAGIAGAFRPGFDYVTFDTDGVRYGAVICFESSFPHLTSGLTKSGAKFLCVLTNDAWYDPEYLIQRSGFWGSLFRVPALRGLASSGPYQHYAHSIYRAIETRRPVVRAANTGISAIINSRGEVENHLPYGKSGVLLGRIGSSQRQLTTYVRFGDWFAASGLLLLAGAAVWQFASRRRILPY